MKETMKDAIKITIEFPDAKREYYIVDTVANKVNMLGSTLLIEVTNPNSGNEVFIASTADVNCNQVQGDGGWNEKAFNNNSVIKFYAVIL